MFVFICHVTGSFFSFVDFGHTRNKQTNRRTFILSSLKLYQIHPPFYQKISTATVVMPPKKATKSAAPAPPPPPTTRYQLISENELILLTHPPSAETFVRQCKRREEFRTMERKMENMKDWVRKHRPSARQFCMACGPLHSGILYARCKFPWNRLLCTCGVPY